MKRLPLFIALFLSISLVATAHADETRRTVKTAVPQQISATPTAMSQPVSNRVTLQSFSSDTGLMDILDLNTRFDRDGDQFNWTDKNGESVQFTRDAVDIYAKRENGQTSRITQSPSAGVIPVTVAPVAKMQVAP